MKINISIMTWINRVLMFPFLISLLIGVYNIELFYYSFLIAFGLGIFQLFSFLITVVFNKRIEIKFKNYMLIYIIIVILFFISFYILSEQYGLFLKIDLLRILFYMTPVLLSLFWTYILESINKKI
jgi:hypothetical protein